jgi:hypothetical protein
LQSTNATKRRRDRVFPFTKFALHQLLFWKITLYLLNWSKPLALSLSLVSLVQRSQATLQYIHLWRLCTHHLSLCSMAGIFMPVASIKMKPNSFFYKSNWNRAKYKRTQLSYKVSIKPWSEITLSQLFDQLPHLVNVKTDLVLRPGIAQCRRIGDVKCWNLRGRHVRLRQENVDVGHLRLDELWTFSWRWRQYVPPKLWYVPTSPHGVATHDTTIDRTIIFLWNPPPNWKRTEWAPPPAVLKAVTQVWWLLQSCAVSAEFTHTHTSYYFKNKFSNILLSTSKSPIWCLLFPCVSLPTPDPYFDDASNICWR